MNAIIRVTGETKIHDINGTIQAVAIVRWNDDETRAMVTARGVVLVYDHAARYYTSCHPLTVGQMARVRRLVKS